MCQLKEKKNILDRVFISEIISILFSIVSSKDVKRDILIFICIADTHLCN